MGLYWNDTVTKKYIRKYLERCREKRAFRPVANADELETIDEFWKSYREMNALITELLTIVSILGRLDNTNLKRITSNLRVVLVSIQKQRDFLSVLRKAFYSIRPTEPEFRGVKRALAQARRRVDYVRHTVIPMNLELTPLKEYLEICGKSELIDDLHERIGNTGDLVEANKDKDLEILNQYVEHVINTVSKAGKASLYEERLNEYVERREKKEQQEKQAKASEKREMMLKEAEEGMMDFCRMFYQTLETFKDNPAINLNMNKLKQVVNRCGRDCYFVLCCYIGNGRRIYRYLGIDDKLSKSFLRGALAFKSQDEAMRAKKRAMDKYPNGVFEIIGLK